MRLDRDSIKEVLDTLSRNRSRTLLTGFGVFWGLFMLLVMIGGGNGLKALISQTFSGFATNTMIMFSNNTTKPYKGLKEGRWWELYTSDMERLRQLVPELDVITPEISKWGAKAEYDSKYFNCVIKGVAPEYDKIETPQLKYGRFINAVDVAMERKVCVIGKRVYDALFPSGGDPCGTIIQVNSSYFRVIGMDLNEGNINVNGSSSESVIIPYSVAMKLYRRGRGLDLICVTGREGVKMSSINTKIRNVIARNHMFDPTDEMALMLLNAEELFSLVDNLFKGLSFLVWLVGLGTILAGAIGVSNIMMVTVRERTSEIGIRRAIGATPVDIVGQITLESVILTVASGMFGIMLATFTLAGLDKAFPDMGFMITFKMAIISTVLLAVLGLLASMAPVSRAMSIKPVDAMREE